MYFYKLIEALEYLKFYNINIIIIIIINQKNLVSCISMKALNIPITYLNI